MAGYFLTLSLQSLGLSKCNRASSWDGCTDPIFWLRVIPKPGILPSDKQILLSSAYVLKANLNKLEDHLVKKWWKIFLDPSLEFSPDLTPVDVLFTALQRQLLHKHWDLETAFFPSFHFLQLRLFSFFWILSWTFQVTLSPSPPFSTLDSFYKAHCVCVVFLSFLLVIIVPACKEQVMCSGSGCVPSILLCRALLLPVVSFPVAVGNLLAKTHHHLNTTVWIQVLLSSHSPSAIYCTTTDKFWGRFHVRIVQSCFLQRVVSDGHLYIKIL